MAINTTRGLPSFSEMLGAFRNRISLGETLKAGLQGYETGVGMKEKAKEAASKSSLRAAQAEEAKAKAESLREGDNTVPLAALPESIQPQLQPYAKMNAAGMLVVPKSAATVALGTTEQGRKQDALAKELALRQEMLNERERSAKEREQLMAENARIREEAGAAGRELSAATTVAETTSRAEPPTLLQKAVLSPIKEAITGDPLSSVLTERQNKAALQKLSETGNIPQPSRVPALTPRPAPTPAPNLATHPLRAKAIQELEAAGAPITDANIAEAIRQLGAANGPRP